MKVCRLAEMRRLDQLASEKYGITQDLLMENAGQAAYETIRDEVGIRGKRFLIFCGIGNNGGDGLVVARKIHSNGGQVQIYLIGDAAKFKGSAKLNWEIVQKIGLPVKRLKNSAMLKDAGHNCDAIVDAIFGTGLDREVDGVYRETIEWINNSGKPVFSLDIPSGVNGDNGRIMGMSVKANSTITFGLPKLGNLLYPGYEQGGKLSVTHISFPTELHTSKDLKIAVNKPLHLPPRRGDAHKGDCGKVLFIAGAANYYGAPYFAALSFLKAGGGLSYLATPETVAPFIAAQGHEIVFVPQKATAVGSIALVNMDRLLEFSDMVDMVVLGPGLSLFEETQRLVRQLAAEINKPLLIDGDGLTAIAKDLACIKHRQAPTILTPHIGEMSRLTGHSLEEFQERRIDILQEATQTLNSCIVLKGAHSLIGIADQNVFINLSGNAGMATAGSGDVLTGTIAAVFGLGQHIEEAVKTGVFLHGLAGDLAAQQSGQDGLLASDIMAALPFVLKKYRENYQQLFENNYGQITVL